MAHVPDQTVVDTGRTDNIYSTNEQPVDMHSKMFMNFPELTPLTSILTKLDSRESFNSRVDWTEQEELPTRIVVTAAAAAGDATITAGDHFTYVRNHDFLWNPKTFEVLKVEGYTTNDLTIDVVRGWGGTTGAAINPGDVLEIFSPSYYEASEEAYPRSPVNTNFHNFTAEMVEFVRTSDRVMAEKTWFAGKGGKRLENQQKMFRAFRLKFEKALLFSYRSDTASTESGFTSQQIKTMGGFVEKLKDGSNYLDVNGVLTETILDDWLTDIYTEYPDTTNLLAVCSPHVYKTINHIAKPLIRLSPNSKMYGMQLKQYEGAVKLDLVPHPLLKGETMKGWMFLLDLSYVKLIYQKRPVLELDVGMKRYNYIEDKYYALASIIIANERRHAMATNILG